MSKTVQFGCFELDLANGSLRKSGRRIHLQSQPLRVLSALVEASGNVVTREQLKALIWPADTFVDFDKSLNTAIMKIRQTLGDSAQSPRYLETVPRLGYRFLAPVIILHAPQQHSGPAIPGSGVSALPLFGWRFALLASGIIAAALTWFFVEQRNQAAPRGYLPSVPFTSLAGSEIVPSFSPDGKKIVFAWDGDRQDNFDIYVKEIASGRMNRLTDDPHPEISPAWSPDGRWIAYVRMLSGTQAQLLVTPAQGFAATRCVASFPAPSTYYERFKFLAWSPDSENLVYSVPERTGDLQGLFLLNVVSGAHRRLTSPPPNYDDLSPSFSNDGAHLAFVRYCGRTSGDLFIMPLPGAKQRTGAPERATFYDRLVSTPAWLADGRNLVFARYEMPGVPSIWRMSWPAKGGPEALPISSDTTFSLDLSRDGKRFVYSREAFNTNIWAIQLEKAGTAQSFYQWARTSSVDYNPQFSPDGKQVAFSSLRSGHSEIWIADSDGSHPRQMTHTNATVSGFPRWAPDGQTLVFHSRTKSSAALYLLNIEDGFVNAIPMVSQNDYNPSFSQDGKWVYFSSRRTGTPEVWKVPARGGTAVQVTHQGGLVPLESPDSRFLYYIKFGPFTLWRQPCAGGPESLVFPGAIAAKGTAYAVTAAGVYLIRSDGERGGHQLGFFDLKNSSFRAIAPIPKPPELGLGVSPDQRTILFSQQDHLESDLMLVENFH